MEEVQRARYTRPTRLRRVPARSEAAPDEDPAELIRELLTIEKKIADGLEKLLKEVEG